MPQNITDVSTFTDPVVIPADSDPADLTYIETLAQGLSNRTRFLRNYCTDTGVVVPAPLQWSRYLGIDSFRPINEAEFSRPTDGRKQSEANSAVGYFDLTPILPRASSIVRVRLLVQPGAVRGTVGNRMTARLIRYTFGASFASPSAGATTVDTETDNGGTSLQWIDFNLTGSPESVAAGAAWGLELACGIDAGTNKDSVYAAQLEFTSTQIGND